MRAYSASELTSGIRFAWVYHRKLRAYLGTPHGGAFGRAGPQPNDPNFVHYVLAARLADRLDVPYEDYIEAHFWAEQQWHARHAQPWFLHQETGWTAAQRIEAWRRAKTAGETGPVLAPGKVARRTKAERRGTQDKYLAQLCAKWQVPPQDVLRALGGPDAGVFDPAWLREQPIWQALDRAGTFAEHPGPDIDYLTRRREEERARRAAALS